MTTNLNAKQDLPLIRGIRVDVQALARLAHVCAPLTCGKRGPACCSHYEVTVTRAEVRRISGIIPDAARYAPGLRDGDDYDNPFDPVGEGLYALDTDERGWCVFSFRGAKGEPLCALHAAALELGRNPYRTKPSVCALWPLALSEDRPPVLSVQPDALDFACNRQRPAGATVLDAGILETLDNAFGQRFRRAVEAALRDDLSPPGVAADSVLEQP